MGVDRNLTGIRLDSMSLDRNDIGFVIVEQEYDKIGHRNRQE
jgi:hypothetical protein